MGCHALLQGVFPTQRLNPGLPHRRRILYYWDKYNPPNRGSLLKPNTTPTKQEFIICKNEGHGKTHVYNHIPTAVYIYIQSYICIYMIQQTYIPICKHVFFPNFLVKSRKIAVTCLDDFSYFLCSQNIMKQPQEQQLQPCGPVSWQTFNICPPFVGRSPLLGSRGFLWFKEIVVQNSEQVLVASIQAATRGQHLRDQAGPPCFLFLTFCGTIYF